MSSRTEATRCRVTTRLLVWDLAATVSSHANAFLVGLAEVGLAAVEGLGVAVFLL
jgi:hypothetical protein